MHEKEKINNLAHVSKILVDFLPIERQEKECAKNSIDFAAELLKLSIPSQRPDIMRIQAAAHLYNMDRVIAFPCIIQGENRVLLRMYGGATPAFCQYLGISLLSENDVHANPIYLSQMEQQYGVILYERQ